LGHSPEVGRSGPVGEALDVMGDWVALLGLPVGIFAEVVITAAGALVALAGLYLAVLAVAALFYRESADPAATSGIRLVVLVPAYNEADLIGRCIASLLDQTYPKGLYHVVVVADNCTDDTALIARREGAQVMVRDRSDLRGKGHALRWAMDEVLADDIPPDAIGVVDADSVAEPNLLLGLVRGVERGAEVVQAEYLVLPEEHSAAAELRAAAVLLFHCVRFSGRAALGLPCNLVGNGMLFTRALLEKHPWNAFSSAEDLEYSIDLRLNGVRPVFARSALVRGPVPTSGKGADVQRRRWEGGRLHVVRTRLPSLVVACVRQRRGSLVDAVIDLAVPPLGLLALAGLAGGALTATLAATDVLPLWTVIPWLVSVAAMAVFVLVGLRAARAPASVYRSLLLAPLFLVRKALGTVNVLKGSRGDEWVRTERPSERSAQNADETAKREH
jgi:1,2-diacylglycerol 3-beta-glucosyltransferase